MRQYAPCRVALCLNFAIQINSPRLYLIGLLTVKVAGNGGCVGTKYFRCIFFTGLLIHINPLLTKSRVGRLKE